MSQVKKAGFEKQLERLNAVVAELEQGELPLEKSVTLYKEGQALVLSCRELLEKARYSVVMHNGEPFTAAPSTPEDPS